MKKPRFRKGILYYHLYQDAESILTSVQAEFPHARIVEHKVGYAIQYYLSGPYYPERLAALASSASAGKGASHE
jgi:hypothetical protein